MIKKPRCQKAQMKQGKMALYCNGEFLCAHQYYCPETRGYENTTGYRKCTRLVKPETQMVDEILVPAQTSPEAPTEAPTEVTYLQLHRYTQNVIPKTEEKLNNVVMQETANKAVPVSEEAPKSNIEEKTVKQSEGRQKDGQVRSTRRRGRKKS